MDPDAPEDVKVKVCANGNCSLEGTNYAELIYRPAQWKEVGGIDRIYCVEDRPEFYYGVGIGQWARISEIFPKETVLSGYCLN